MVNYGVLQADDRLKLQFNVDLFMKCFSYIDDSGERMTAAPWIFAPGWRPKGASRALGQRGEPAEELESTAEFRGEAMKRLRDHELYTAQFIPHCVVNDDKVEALTDDDMKSLIARPQRSYAKFSIDARIDAGMAVTMSLPSRVKQKAKAKKTVEEDEDEDDEEVEEREDRGPLSSQFHELVNTAENAASVRAKESKDGEKEKRKNARKLLKEQKKAEQALKEQEKTEKDRKKAIRDGKRKATAECDESNKRKKRKNEIESEDGKHALPTRYPLSS